MRRWQATFYLLILWENSLVVSLLSGKSILKIIPDLLGRKATDLATDAGTEDPGTIVMAMTTMLARSDETTTREPMVTAIAFQDKEPDPPDESYPVQYASVPKSLEVYPLPLPGSDHELMFNVTWSAPSDYPARDYSLEVYSVTDTTDCKTPLMCYEYNIPGETQWWLVPAYANPVAESCAVRPGCAYAVLLTAHPWDGRSQAEKVVQLDECVSGVCSCAHSPRLPAPVVSASTVVMHGEIYVNVTWTLPKPRFPQRLPRDLKKQNYLVSIGKQMVTDAHPAPWFANTITRPVDADGLVADGDGTRWVILPITERSLARGPSESRGGSSIVLDVKLLARVSLMDDRGCVGPAGNATAYDPSEARKIQFSTYLLWAIFGGLCVLAMVALFAMSSRIVKRILSALRPAAPAPLSPLRHRPAWFTLQFQSVNVKQCKYIYREIDLTIIGWRGCFNSSLISCCPISQVPDKVPHSYLADNAIQKFDIDILSWTLFGTGEIGPKSFFTGPPVPRLWLVKNPINDSPQFRPLVITSDCQNEKSKAKI
ncbi:hypothetical protein ABMA28_017034 [Loxostege sticticalis]|uniref:Fibronectin type-III domain-containing protein n=1 Tax=Loxostege sticticalis TaxID=481309 RepID=A0ABD0T9M5_LOXSC